LKAAKARDLFGIGQSGETVLPGKNDPRLAGRLYPRFLENQPPIV
jgi:hypothetical protein